MDLKEAEAALAAAVEADNPPKGAAEPAPPATPDPPQDEAPPAAEAQTDQEALTLQALLTSVPDEYRSTVEQYVTGRDRAMQGDYTRKTQELADQRKAVEADLAFLESIRTDGQAALEFHAELTAALVEAGLTPAQAAAAADQAVDEAQSEDPAPDYADDPDGALLAKVNALQARLDERDASAAAEAEAAAVQAFEARLATEEAQIRQQNPTYTQQHIDAIYDIGFSPRFNGDLLKAQEAFEVLRNSVIEDYANRKLEEAERGGEPSAGGSAVTPIKFDTVEEAHEAAVEKLRNALAQSD